jgi:hypothetical protein
MMSKKEEEFIRRQKALGYEPSLDGLDEEDFDYVPSWMRDRQPQVQLAREFRPVDRDFAERILRMFERKFDPNWEMPNLDGPEFRQTKVTPMAMKFAPDGAAAEAGGQPPIADATNRLPEGTMITSNDAGANLNQIMTARDIPDITDRLHALMTEYEEKFKDIKDKPISERLDIFHRLVKDHGILDLKRQPGWDSPKFIYNGEVVNNDVPGNILYGYLGKHFDFPDTVLYAGAGYNQMANDSQRMREEGKSPLGALRGFNLESFGDDPRDTARIRQGIEVWNKKYVPKPPLVYGD